MKLSIEQDLPVGPEAVWPFVTEPALMNRWSRAEIQRLQAGDGEGPGGVGELRRVTVRSLGSAVRFDEVIEHAEPPHRLVYRVIEGLPVRYHRGAITLSPSETGTRLCWEVEYAFPLPGMALGAQAVLVPQLEDSLKELRRACEGALAVPCSRPSWRDDADDDPTLWSEALRVLDEQNALADRMAARGDPKQWFTRVYAIVTETQMRACQTQRTTHRGWVLRLIRRFHDYYVGNLRRFCGEQPGHVEHHWRHAFNVMERGDGAAVLAHGLREGVRAHIEQDLPRALADVYVNHYADRCSYARLRADFLLMNGIIRYAADRLLDRVPRAYLPPLVWMLGPMLPSQARDVVMARRFYDVIGARRLAFERGGAIACARLACREGSPGPTRMAG
jgi:uncharacterized protein YndB with AHSA1/START domain